MPIQYSKIDQVSFLNKWFDTWSELQKDDFLPILSQSVNPEKHLNGFVGNIPDISEDRKKPSIFDCQVKLFQEWYCSWEDNYRQDFRNHIKEADETFSNKLEAVIRGDLIENPDMEHLDYNQMLTLSPLSLNELDEGMTAQSSASSTLSSLSHSQSNNDSGLETIKSDGEPIKEGN